MHIPGFSRRVVALSEREAPSKACNLRSDIEVTIYDSVCLARDTLSPNKRVNPLWRMTLQRPRSVSYLNFRGGRELWLTFHTRCKSRFVERTGWRRREQSEGFRYERSIMRYAITKINMKIKFLGRDNGTQRERDADLLLSIISKVSQRKIEITDRIRDADLVIVYPYVVGRFSYRFKWLVINVAMRIMGTSSHSSAATLRWLLGVGHAKLLFVSHENLDRSYWWNMIGRFLINTDIPRLTFWPKEVDPKGARFPYWYNYIDWPDYPRENLYERFGRLYNIDELTRPLQAQEGRMPCAVAVGSHVDFPRAALLNSVEGQMRVDCFGGMGKKLFETKLELMQKYKYAFCPENSTGYGYDTEKLPEAWVAGCVPVGFYLNPFSDFNPKIANCAVANNLAYEQPLLLTPPKLEEVENYVRSVI
jgi:hypothetical protein